MAYLALRGVGKIYVSEGSVAVGIRGVTLDFELGEFVAITGKSGSGKSTLLNVISGMDSYEEGEILIEGSPTSHYLQKDWEEFREKYISFIFQDYNIIESFTVLENVELALMHIEDKKERRRRAKALLDKVGLTSHLKHKGSRLSGGQKQRVVIARALAKDSPILLADEPTGNLDSESAKEIVTLLHEISKEKLVIVVTHNFEQLAGYATRHVRVFDGAIERDQTLAERRSDKAVYPAHEIANSGKKRNLKNGLTLGKSIFTSRPRLSFFLCLLMIIGTLALFVITGFSGSAFDIFKPHYMFTPIKGRVILTSQNGEPLTEEELKSLVTKYGATSYLHYDKLLDETREVFIPSGNWGEYVDAKITFGETLDGDVLGRYPEKPNEVLLSLPISHKKAFGENEIRLPYVMIDNTVYDVVGIHYEIDNNLTAKALMSEEGYQNALAISYINSSWSDPNSHFEVVNEEGLMHHIGYGSDIVVSYALEDGKIYFKDYDSLMKDFKNQKVSVSYTLNIKYTRYENYSQREMYFEKVIQEDEFITDGSKLDLTYGNYFLSTKLEYSSVFLSPSLAREMVEAVLQDSYRQASLFFESDSRAEEVAKLLSDTGYRAVDSKATYSPDGYEVITEVISCLMSLLLWVAFVLFLSFFISLCTGRALAAFKGDMAIMRSMGISVRVIRIAMYVRMLISLIPAFITTVLAAFLLYTSPTVNAFLTYLYPWQYALIFAGMLLLVHRVTKKQIAKLFKESVKKALKGGDAA